ncbi:MAG TPA: glutaredoxin family protein [Candidatus Saccharimonadales bacterium]|nr:glutaredoxin family protein [Candidatus Saccharimonadales bacterium]
MSDNQIIIYGAEWCGFCHMAKRYLDDKGIKYHYIDIDTDPKAGMEAIEKSGQRGIPVIDMGGDIILGFDRPKIDASLKKLQLVN